MSGCPLSRRGCAVMLTQHDTQLPLSPAGRWPGVFGLWIEITQRRRAQGNKKPLFRRRQALSRKGPCARAGR